MPPWLIGLLVILTPVGLGVLLYKGLQRAEETDRPLVRLAIRVSLSAFLLLLIGGFLRVLLRASAGSMVAGFGLALLIAGGAAVLGILLALIWAPEIGSLLARPFTSLFMGSDDAPEQAPQYSLLETRRKQGRHAEAIEGIERQLERFPDDAQGWFLLADIQMDNLHDFHLAAATLQKFLSRPGLSPQSIVMARLRLADWNLRYRQDYEAARALLQAIVGQYPDLPQARLAYQRLAHLDEVEGFSAEHAGAVPLGPAADPQLGLHAAREGEGQTAENVAEDITPLLEHLERFPLDREVREKLAIHYARVQHRPDLCAEQVEYLVGLPEVRPSEVARWLHLLADVYVKEAHDFERARATLGRLIAMFPDSATAAQAQRRMEVLKREVRGAEAGKTVKLGIYPQNIGLGGRIPRR